MAKTWYLAPISYWNMKHKRSTIGTTAKKSLSQLINYNREIEIDLLNETMIRVSSEKDLIEKFLYFDGLDYIKIMKKILDKGKLREFIMALISRWPRSTPIEREKLKIFFILIKQKRPEIWEKIKRWFK